MSNCHSSIGIDYQQDYYAWIMHNAGLIRQGRLTELDAEHIADELEAMGRAERQQLVNRLSVLMAHLLKWVYQPERRSRSWRYTIAEQREIIRQLLRDSPSLKHQLDDALSDAYRLAILKAARETRLEKKKFPSAWPCSFECTMAEDYYPDHFVCIPLPSR